MDDAVLEKGFAAVADMVEHVQRMLDNMKSGVGVYRLAEDAGQAASKVLQWKQELQRGLELVKSMERFLMSSGFQVKMLCVCVV